MSGSGVPQRGGSDDQPCLVDIERFPALVDGRFGRKSSGTGLRILHVTNVAQNAYINASILNARGHDCDVFAPDLYHAASAPEWYELSGTDVDTNQLGGNPNFPDFYALGRDMPRIADWVAHGPFFVAMHYLILRRRRDPLAHTALSVIAYLRFKATIQRHAMVFAVPFSDEEFAAHLGRYDLHPVLKRRISAGRVAERYFEWVRSRLKLQMPEEHARDLTPPWEHGSLDGYFGKDAALKGVVEALRRRGLSQLIGLEFPGRLELPRHLAAKGLQADEMTNWTWFGKVWRDLVSYYDVCIFYGDSSRFALASGIENYCALEHGTIRSMPFEPTVSGRVLADAYRNAARVFLTNTDYATAKQRLEFSREQRIYAPHPFDEAPAFAFRNSHVRCVDLENIVFFCPARQDWLSEDPKMAKGNDRYFRAAKLLLDRGRTNFVLYCVDWGIDCDASRRLIDELGLTDHVRWTPLLSKRKLWAAMLDAHAVIDQFLISAFGGATFETFALGCRIISRDDGVNNGVFFAEPPPILAAQWAEDIAARMTEVLDDPDDLKGFGAKGISWVEKYHSAEQMYQIQLKAFAGLPVVGHPSMNGGGSEADRDGGPR